jgi:hypothetical protein
MNKVCVSAQPGVQAGLAQKRASPLTQLQGLPQIFNHRCVFISFSFPHPI